MRAHQRIRRQAPRQGKTVPPWLLFDRPTCPATSRLPGLLAAPAHQLPGRGLGGVVRDIIGAMSRPVTTKTRSPLQVGGLLAVMSAIAFGLTTPLVKVFGGGAAPLAVASLLYAGAALGSLGSWGSTREAPLRREHLPRLLAVALVGAVIAPTLLVWGLGHTDASTASLLLNFEALFTALLGATLFREPIGRRMALALFVMVAGGVCSMLAGTSVSGIFGLGALGVVGATLAWAVDNALTRPLADLDPTQVVRWKAVLGAGLGLLGARVLGEPLPALRPGLALLACGMVGYGLSLRLYLLAQRRLGAGRTGSIFAVAPFVGASVAWLMGERVGGWWTLASAVLFGGGVYLHLTETHSHRHIHEPLEHEHAHRHDEPHHQHVHDEPVVGQHSHPHRHDPLGHEHAHGPDLHHQHQHT
jgi:drug/metabolite transporter (DMT)-like permease